MFANSLKEFHDKKGQRLYVDGIRKLGMTCWDKRKQRKQYFPFKKLKCFLKKRYTSCKKFLTKFEQNYNNSQKKYFCFKK